MNVNLWKHKLISYQAVCLEREEHSASCHSVSNADLPSPCKNIKIEVMAQVTKITLSSSGPNLLYSPRSQRIEYTK